MGRIDGLPHLRRVGGGGGGAFLQPVFVAHGDMRAGAVGPGAVDQQARSGSLGIHQCVSPSSDAGVVTTRNTRPAVPVLVKLWRMPGGT